MGTLRKRILFALLAAIVPLIAGCTRHSKKEHQTQQERAVLPGRDKYQSGVLEDGCDRISEGGG